jgi:hypothetical protein
MRAHPVETVFEVEFFNSPVAIMNGEPLTRPPLGSTFRVAYAAPGIGHAIYRAVRYTDDGDVVATMVRSEMREMTRADVE